MPEFWSTPSLTEAAFYALRGRRPLGCVYNGQKKRWEFAMGPKDDELLRLRREYNTETTLSLRRLGHEVHAWKDEMYRAKNGARKGESNAVEPKAIRVGVVPVG